MTGIHRWLVENFPTVLAERIPARDFVHMSSADLVYLESKGITRSQIERSDSIKLYIDSNGRLTEFARAIEIGSNKRHRS